MRNERANRIRGPLVHCADTAAPGASLPSARWVAMESPPVCALHGRRRGAVTALPLAGFRVLDLGVVLAGPQAGLLLADLGAEVIRVESTQHFPPQTRGIYAHPTKESIMA